MQMARWFGYRPGYEDICRIYLPESAASHYRHISIAIEELLNEIKSMPASQTPIDFGLRVRQSPTGIRITAANKMRSAQELRLAADYAGRYVQGHAIFNDQKANSRHIKVVKSFLEKHCSSDTIVTIKSSRPYWKDINGGAIVRLMESFNFPAKVLPLSHIRGRDSLLGEYIKDRLSGELALWDVVITTRKSAKGSQQPVKDLLKGCPLYPTQRTKARVENNIYRFTGTSNSAGDQDSVKLGLTDEQLDQAEILKKQKTKGRNVHCQIRTRPLLIIYTIATPTDIKSSKLKDYAVSLGFCMPETERRSREQTYQVNKVFQQSTFSYFDDDFDDDEDADAINQEG
jgi:hypothetical protein